MARTPVMASPQFMTASPAPTLSTPYDCDDAPGTNDGGTRTINMEYDTFLETVGVRLPETIWCVVSVEMRS